MKPESNTTGKSRFRSLFSGLIPLFVLAHCGHHLLTSLPVPLSPMIRSAFNLDYTRSGWVISAFSLAYGISQVPSGWLTGRIGPRIMVTIGICGVAIAGLLVGLSQTYVMLIGFLALMGLMGGGYHPSATAVISTSVEPKKRGRALGLHLIGGSASHFLAPLIAAGIAATWSWRGPFIVLAIPAFIFGIIFYVLLGRYQPASKAEQKGATSYIETPQTPGRRRRLMMFLTLSVFTQAMMYSTISFIPLFLVDHFGIAKETAAAIIALVYSSGLWAGPLGGYLSDRWGRIPVMLAICLFAGPAIYLLSLAPYPLGVSALLITIGVVLFVRMAVSEAYISDHTTASERTTILGIYFFFAMESGGVMTPVMGYLIDHLGFYNSFSIAAAAQLAMTLVFSPLLWRGRD